MAPRTRLTDHEWHRIEAVLQEMRSRFSRRGRPPQDDRNFIEAVIWATRTGAPWRDLPDEFGPWNSVYNRFDNWAKSGRWQFLLERLKTDVDDEWHSIDSTINRAHQHSAGAKGGAKTKASAARAAARARRFTSSSTRSDSRSRSR